MRRGRPPKDLHEFDKDLIGVKLSFNQIKYLLYIFRMHQPSSVEGQVCKKFADGLRKYLMKRAKEGMLPQSVIDKFLIVDEDKFVDKSTIKPKTQGPGNG